MSKKHDASVCVCERLWTVSDWGWKSSHRLSFTYFFQGCSGTALFDIFPCCNSRAWIARQWTFEAVCSSNAPEAADFFFLSHSSHSSHRLIKKNKNKEKANHAWFPMPRRSLVSLATHLVIHAALYWSCLGTEWGLDGVTSRHEARASTRVHKTSQNHQHLGLMLKVGL